MLKGGLGTGRQCDRSRTEVDKVSRSSAEATSLASTKEISWSLVRSSPFSLERAETWLNTVSSWLVMATIPETVVYRMDRVEPSPTKMVWRACGVRLGVGWGRARDCPSF